MTLRTSRHRRAISRRAMLASTFAMAATPALADACQVGPPPHHK
jgi:arylformamidase